MSDEPEEEHNTRQSTPVLTVVLRKIIFALFLVFGVWLVSTKYVGLAPSPRPNVLGSRELQQRNEPKSVAASPVKETPSKEPVAYNNEEVTQLRSRIDQLEARLKTVEETASQKPAVTSAESPAAAAVDNTRVTQMEAQAAVDKERIAHLEEELHKHGENLTEIKTQLGEIDTIKTRISSVQSRTARQLSALTMYGAMKESVGHGEPVPVQLDQIGKLAQDFPANKARIEELLGKLKPMIEKGAVTLPALHSQFETLLPDILAPAAKTSAWARSMQSLIRIRKVGEQQSGTDDESVLARAEAHLSREEVEEALKEMTALSAEALKAAQPWMVKSKEYLQTRTLMDALQVALVQDSPEAPVTAAPEPATATPTTTSPAQSE